MTTKLTARATRTDKWWVVYVEELGGFYTQAKRLDQVEAMVKDAAALLTEQPEDTFEVTVVPQLKKVEENLLRETLKTREEYEKIAKDFQERSKKTVDTLVSEGFSYRDIGELIGVSFQRVAKIHNAKSEDLKRAA